jgi:peroxiredoxin
VVTVAGHERSIGVGDRAPDFRLRHTCQAEVGLGETLERGPVVLAFYVFDFGGY